MTDKEIVERAKEAEKRTCFGEIVHSPISKGVNSAYGIGFIEGMEEYRNSLQEEPVSEELEDFAKRQADEFAEREYEVDSYDRDCLSKGYYWGCKAGAKWQKKHLWKPADGDDLPEIDREVIALQEVTEGSYELCFAHRPDTTRCTTIPTPSGNIEDVPIATYGKGNWNIGEIKWWLDLPLPYEELEENEESICKPYEGIINELYKTYKKKNADYGNSFAETIQEFGFIPAVARINDKVKRIKNLVKGQKMNVNESLRDNLMDVVNYCIMTIMSLDEEINKK